jgi:hypothetical protein
MGQRLESGAELLLLAEHSPVFVQVRTGKPGLHLGGVHGRGHFSELLEAISLWKSEHLPPRHGERQPLDQVPCMLNEIAPRDDGRRAALRFA